METGAEDRVARQVSVCVVQELEVVEIQDEDAHLHAVPSRVRDLRGQPLHQVLAVVGTGEAVARGALVELVLQLRLAAIDHVEPEHERGPELHAVTAGQQRRLLHAHGGDERAVRGAQVLQVPGLALLLEASVRAADSCLFHRDLGLVAAANGEGVTIEHEHLTRVEPGDHRERRGDAVVRGGYRERGFGRALGDDLTFGNPAIGRGGTVGRDALLRAERHGVAALPCTAA